MKPTAHSKSLQHRSAGEPAATCQFVTSSSDKSIEHLDAWLDCVVAGTVHSKPLLLSGPVASGKRALARAIARDLAGPVVEIDAQRVPATEELRDVLRVTPPGGTIVFHNVEELSGTNAQLAYHALARGTVDEPRAKGAEPDEGPPSFDVFSGLHENDCHGETPDEEE